MIPLHKVRDFGAIIGDLFLFLKENYKPLLGYYVKYGVVLVTIGLVVQVIVGYSLSSSISSEDPSVMLLLASFFIILFFILGFYMVNAAVYAYMEGYAEGGEQAGREGVSKNLWRNVGKLVVLTIFIVVVLGVIFGALVLLMVGLASISPILATLFALLGIGLIFLYIYIVVKFYLAMFIYTLPGTGLIESFKKSWELVKGKWWRTFGSYFVISMITSVISYIFIIPMYLLMIIPFIGGMTDPDEALQSMMTTGPYAMFIMYLGTLLVYVINLSITPLMYYSYMEEDHGVSLEQDIQDLNEGGQQSMNSFFENEGDV